MNKTPSFTDLPENVLSFGKSKIDYKLFCLLQANCHEKFTKRATLFSATVFLLEIQSSSFKVDL